MQEKNEEVNSLLSDLKEHSLMRLELYKAHALEHGSRLFADLVTNTFVAICCLLAFLFGTATIGFYLAELLESFPLGFLALTVFYLLIALIVFFTSDRFIEKVIINFSIRKLIKKYIIINEQA